MLFIETNLPDIKDENVERQSSHHTIYIWYHNAIGFYAHMMGRELAGTCQQIRKWNRMSFHILLPKFIMYHSYATGRYFM